MKKRILLIALAAAMAAMTGCSGTTVDKSSKSDTKQEETKKDETNTDKAEEKTEHKIKEPISPYPI